MYRFAGIGILLVVDLVLFGLPGLLIYLVQMLWIPLWAAGVINGVDTRANLRNEINLIHAISGAGSGGEHRLGRR